MNDKSVISVYAGDNRPYCPFSLQNATEGSGIPPRITKDTVLNGYHIALCRTFPFVFNQTLIHDTDIAAFKFSLANQTFHHPKDPKKYCLKHCGSVSLPDGVIDYSKCSFGRNRKYEKLTNFNIYLNFLLGMPVAVSNPHFLNFPGPWNDYIDGFHPTDKDHSSYIVIEPKTGVLLEAVGRIQVNFPMPSLKVFPEQIQKFHNMILPFFWMEWVRNQL